MAATKHLFHLQATRPQTVRTGGTRIDATADNFSVLSGMALSMLTLQPRAFREPHWHPNANELGLCCDGKGLMTIFGPSNHHDTFTFGPGDILFVPKGSLHHIENIGDTPLRMALCFDHERPEDLEISTSVKVMPDHILGATFRQKATFFDRLQKTKSQGFIGLRESVTHSTTSMMTARYKLSLGEVQPQAKGAGGWVKMSNNFLLPTLQGIAVYDLLLHPKGAREPHWHPNANELNLLLSGSARITLLSPKGQVDTFDMGPGDISFLPQGYLHHIENTGSQDAHYAVFFNHSAPSDIGISGCLGAYSNDILASLFDVPLDYLKDLPKYQKDLLIISGGG